jgi:hypothetical protein
MVQGIEIRKLAEPPSFRFHTVAVHKWRQWAWAVCGQARASIFEAFFAWVGGVAIGIGALYLLHRSGTAFLRTDGSANTIALIVAGLAWFGVVCLSVVVWSLFTAKSRLNKLGSWHGNKFVFREPQYIATVMAAAADSGRKLRITVGAAPKYSVVRCQIENVLNSHLLRAIAHSPYYIVSNWENFAANKPWPNFSNGPLNAAVRLGRHKEFYLEWKLPPNALLHEMRIKVFSFEIQDSKEVDGYKFFHWHISQPSNDLDAYGR